MVWPDSIVEENNLSQNISLLRKTLSVCGEEFITTVPKHGYRFIARVEEVSAPSFSQANKPFRPPETRYVRNGDVTIAYQVLGDGPVDLVFVMGWVSHLEYFWTEPSFGRFLRRLASFSRVILFDKRGTGLSDRVPISQLPTLEERMDDVRAVRRGRIAAGGYLRRVRRRPMLHIISGDIPAYDIGIDNDRNLCPQNSLRRLPVGRHEGREGIISAGD